MQQRFAGIVVSHPTLENRSSATCLTKHVCCVGTLLLLSVAHRQLSSDLYFKFCIMLRVFFILFYFCGVCFLFLFLFFVFVYLFYLFI